MNQISPLHRWCLISGALFSFTGLHCALNSEGTSAHSTQTTQTGGDGGSSANSSTSSSASSGSSSTSSSGSSTTGSSSSGTVGSSSSSSSTSSSSSSSSGTGSSSSGGGSVDCPAGSVRDIKDDFGDFVYSQSLWWPYMGGPQIQSNGLLTVSPLPYVKAYGGYIAKSGKNLFNCSMSINVKQMLNSSAAGIAYFEAIGPDSQGNKTNKITMLATSQNLYYSLIQDGNEIFMGNDSLDMPSMAYWQMRETQGTLYFETSPDGLSWQERDNTPAPPFLNSVTINIGAGSNNTGSNPGAAHFDNVNIY